MSQFTNNCEGRRRRDFIQAGLGALGGMGLTQMLAAQASAAADPKSSVKPNDTRCIFIWLDGGPTHYETFDPKPDAPGEIRGDYDTIPTKVPGVHFSQYMKGCADAFDKFTVIRSITHDQNNHGAGNHFLMTGAPTPVPVGCGAFVTFHPSMGSVISKERGVQKGLPPYVTMPRVSRSGGPNFLGASHGPFVIKENPDSESFRVRDVSIPETIVGDRANNRRDLRKSLDRLKRINDEAAQDPAISFDKFYEQSYDLVYSDEAQKAFDISAEPDEVREKYGRNDFGQRCLLARRLTEVGVPWVTVYSGGWDHHRGLFKSCETALPKTDQGVSALINDLAERGTLDNTMVFLLGEFGRTPKINKDAGRDHWSFAMSVLAAGGGIPGGQIIGATDVKGYYANENIYSPRDFAASIYHKMGIDHQKTLIDPVGRPISLVTKGKLIKELFV
ncbi:MAG: DUF1501 domain-containing protein [Verrucomicrobiota bacterium]